MGTPGFASVFLDIPAGTLWISSPGHRYTWRITTGGVTEEIGFYGPLPSPWEGCSDLRVCCGRVSDGDGYPTYGASHLRRSKRACAARVARYRLERGRGLFCYWT